MSFLQPLLHPLSLGLRRMKRDETRTLLLLAPAAHLIKTEIQKVRIEWKQGAILRVMSLHQEVRGVFVGSVVNHSAKHGLPVEK